MAPIARRPFRSPRPEAPARHRKERLLELRHVSGVAARERAEHGVVELLRCLDVVGTDHVDHHLTHELGLGRMVDRRWVIAHKLEFAGGPHGSAKAGADLSHALFDQIQYFDGEGAHSAL